MIRNLKKRKIFLIKVNMQKVAVKIPIQLKIIIIIAKSRSMLVKIKRNCIILRKNQTKQQIPKIHSLII